METTFFPKKSIREQVADRRAALAARIPDADANCVWLICHVRVTGGLDPVSAHAEREAAESAMVDLGEPGPCGGERHIILRMPVEGMVTR